MRTSPQIGKYNTFLTFLLSCIFSHSCAKVEPLHRFLRWMAQTTCFRPRTVLLGVSTMGDVKWGKYAPKTPKRGGGVNRQFQAKTPNFIHFIHIGPPTTEIWRHIDFSRWQPLNTVSCLLMLLPTEGQSLSANQISSTYLNSWLRYNYFWFGKENVRHIWIFTISGFVFDHVTVIGVWLCTRLLNFVRIGPPSAEQWRNSDF